MVIGRTGPVRSGWSETHLKLCAVASDWSSGDVLVCGMKRGIGRQASALSVPRRHQSSAGGKGTATTLRRLTHTHFCIPWLTIRRGGSRVLISGFVA